jgi:hypothetical protein
VDLPADDVETIAVSAFKPRSLDLDRAGGPWAPDAPGGDQAGRAAVALVPVLKQPVELRGALRELMEPVEGTDLTAPVGEPWAAERG